MDAYTRVSNEGGAGEVGPTAGAHDGHERALLHVSAHIVDDDFVLFRAPAPRRDHVVQVDESERHRCEHGTSGLGCGLHVRGRRGGGGEGEKENEAVNEAGRGGELG